MTLGVPASGTLSSGGRVWEIKGTMIRPHRRFATILAASAFLWACELPVEPEVAVEDEGPVREILRSAAATAQSTSNYAAAVNYYQTLSSRDPNDIEALLGLARNLRYIGAPADAIRALKEGVANHPDRIDLRAELGKAQLARGLAGDAVDTLTEVTEAVPNDWQSFSALGIAYDLLEKFPDAQSSYESALAG